MPTAQVVSSPDLIADELEAVSLTPLARPVSGPGCVD
jgi:hypothetical protein